MCSVCAVCAWTRLPSSSFLCPFYKVLLVSVFPPLSRIHAYCPKCAWPMQKWGYSGHYYSSAPLQMEAICSSETSVRITNQHVVIRQKTLIFINKQGWNNMAPNISNIVRLSILSILLVWLYIYGLKYKGRFQGPIWLKIGTVPQLLEKICSIEL